MAKEQYLSGPWVAELQEGGYQIKQQIKGWITQHIAIVNTNASHSTNRGNAQLIKSAPVMYQALEAILEAGSSETMIKIAKEALQEVDGNG